MSDYSTQNMSLGALVKLTRQFLNAAQFEIRSRDIANPDLHRNLSAEQQQRLQDLRFEATDINDRAQKLMMDQTSDPVVIGALTAQMNLVALHMCDVLMEGAQKLLGRDYLTFIAPDELHSASAINLMQTNNASTLASLAKISMH